MPALLTAREALLDELVERERLWPIIDHCSCRSCARPRDPDRLNALPTCPGCGWLRQLYGDALADLVPITYSACGWPLNDALRRFKDDWAARPAHPQALRFAAVLSAFLEAQLPRLAPGAGFGIVMAVPSSKPVVPNCLARAASEGWWVPELVPGLVEIRPGLPRQRTRKGRERARVKGKWGVDAASVAGEELLLLDDLMTSGGTVHSLARALRDAGAASVSAVVLGRNLASDGDWFLPALRAAVARGHVWTASQNKRDVLG